MRAEAQAKAKDAFEALQGKGAAKRAAAERGLAQRMQLMKQASAEQDRVLESELHNTQAKMASRMSKQQRREKAMLSQSKDVAVSASHEAADTFYKQQPAEYQANVPLTLPNQHA